MSRSFRPHAQLQCLAVLVVTGTVFIFTSGAIGGREVFANIWGFRGVPPRVESFGAGLYTLSLSPMLHVLMVLYRIQRS